MHLTFLLLTLHSKFLYSISLFTSSKHFFYLCSITSDLQKSLSCTQISSNVFYVGTAEDLVDTFFKVEVEMEKEVCRDLVCTSSKDEEGFSNDFLNVVLLH